MTLTLHSPEEIERAAKNLFYVASRYAQAVDHFHNVHGHPAKDAMNRWRNKLLDCLKNPGKEIDFRENINLEYEQ